MGRYTSQERWAFAFSAKKAWRQKARSDVKKIVNTNRNYKLIYFITNQFVKDKTRPQIEEELTKKYNVSVRILDRSWIVKCIFEHDRLRLAAETLNIAGYDETTRKVAGPHDVEREAELKELEQQINDPARYRGVQYQLAEDCLQAALLARGLELPRVEVEGRFLRAERIAEREGHRQQRLRISYARAWTAFWWYEDFEELNRLYDQVEELAIGSMQATDLKLLANLWTALYTTVSRTKLDAQDAKIDVRTKRLKSELDRLSCNNQRPNNALMARTDILLMELNEAMATSGSLDAILTNLKKVLIASEGLTEFPLHSIMQIIRELGELLADNTAYDELFDVVVNLTERRTSEGEAGLVLLQRGYQKLQAGKKYDAIRLLGRAQQKLAMSEYQAQWVTALAGCGLAYEAAGLLWAARANMLIAANQALSEFLKNGKIIPQTLRYLQKLVWLELQLGQVFPALAWVELASLIAHNLMLEGDRKEEYLKERESQDLVLGLLLLKTDLWELKWLDFLPQILKEFGFDHSWMALLYALGQEDYLRSEGVIPESESPKATLDLFGKWLDQPANEDLPNQPDLMRSDKITLRSFVLGCEVIVEAANIPASVNLAETILAALEAFLATCLDFKSGVIPSRSELRINIHPSDFIESLPEYQINDADGGQTINIRHSLTTQKSAGQEDKGFRSWLLDFILKTTFQMAMVNDPKAFAKRIVQDELGVGRALNFSEVVIPIENILGGTPKLRLSDWETQAGTERFALRRNLPWSHDLKQESTNEEVEEPLWQPGEGEPPDDLFGIDNLKHKDYKILSLINIPLWEKAKWRATAYMYHPESNPILVLCFKNPEAAKQIFKEWRSKLGQVDEDEQLRVSIITGIDKKHPSSYNVVISTNLKLMAKSQRRYFVLVSRINRMDPPDLRNLNLFLEEYNRTGRYIILPAHFADIAEIPKPFWDLWIGKQELRISPAWQIGENDPDVWAVQEEDDPIIPDGIENAPVIRALQRFGKRTKSP
jgi:hypothetical protein